MSRRRDKTRPHRTTITPSGTVMEERARGSRDFEPSSTVGMMNRLGEFVVLYIEGSTVTLGVPMSSRAQAEELLAGFRRIIDATWSPG